MMPRSSKKSERICPQFQPLPKFYSASRELRNQAEKQRRDKLNYYVSELGSMVPFVANAQKKVDKTSVLRLAASYIRITQILRRCSPNNLPTSVNLDANISNALLKLIGGFLLVVTSSGKIVYVSEAVQETFGYSQADILGQNILPLLHSDDVGLFQQNLKVQENSRRSFYCRMQEKGISRNDTGRYEIIHVAGLLKELPQDQAPPSSPSPLSPGQGAPFKQENNASASPDYKTSLRNRRASSSSSKYSSDMDYSDENDDCDSIGFSYSQMTRDTHILVALVQVVEPPVTNLSWVESLKDEYITRHTMDGSIVYADHRISCVLGFMPSEVTGSSAFKFMRDDDVLWAFLLQAQMMQSPEGQGNLFFRISTSDKGKYICLRTRGYLEVDKSSKEVSTFICINTIISEEEGEREIIKQRKAIRPIMENLNPNDILSKLDYQPNLKEFLKRHLPKKKIKWLLDNIENPSVGNFEHTNTTNESNSRNNSLHEFASSADEHQPNIIMEDTNIPEEDNVEVIHTVKYSRVTQSCRKKCSLDPSINPHKRKRIRKGGSNFSPTPPSVTSGAPTNSRNDVEGLPSFSSPDSINYRQQNVAPGKDPLIPNPVNKTTDQDLCISELNYDYKSLLRVQNPQFSPEFSNHGHSLTYPSPMCSASVQQVPAVESFLQPHSTFASRNSVFCENDFYPLHDTISYSRPHTMQNFAHCSQTNHEGDLDYANNLSSFPSQSYIPSSFKSSIDRT